MDIIDTPFNTTPKIPCLVSQGVGTVIRYYNFSNSLSFPDKCLQLPEAQALGAQGLRIAVVFQQRQNQVADFSESKGLAAGRRAYRHAHDNIGQPGGSAIYFSVDFDAPRSQITNNVVPYFEGIKRAFDDESDGAPEFRLGAYGSGLVCGTLTRKNSSTSRGWRCHAGFPAPARPWRPANFTWPSALRRERCAESGSISTIQIRSARTSVHSRSWTTPRSTP